MVRSDSAMSPLDFAFDCPRIGVRWSSAAFPDLLTRYMLFEGCYQEDVIVTMRAVLHPGDTVFDVGAHHGLMSVVASSLVGAKGSVVAFEPNPEARRQIARHLALNDCENVRVEPIALSDANGHADFFVQTGDVTWNSSLVREFVDPARRTQPIRVETMRLDDFVLKHGVAPTLVKIDVEGGEIAVLHGARQVISQHRPSLVLEFNPKAALAAGTSIEELSSWLRDLGYRIFVVERDWRGFYHFDRQMPFDPALHCRGGDLRNVVCQAAS